MAIRLGSAYGIVGIKDEASPAVKNIEKSMGGLETSSKSLKGKLADLSGGLGKGGLGGSLNDAARELTGFSLSSLGVGAALTGVVVGIKKSITETMEYGKQVDDLSRALGTSAEEASKLIQIGDDLRIEVSTLKMGFKAALQEGIAPNIDGLKQMAREYQALPGPVEKSQYALDKFGRAGLEMNKILELSPEKLDEMARSAEEMGLVLSQKDVDATIALYEELDNLSDRLEGIKTKIGTALIPALVDAAGAFELLISWNDRLNSALEEHNQEVARTADSYRDYVVEMTRAAVAAGKLTEWERDQLLATDMSQEAIDAIAKSTGYYEESTRKAYKEVGLLTEAEWEQKRATEQTTEATEDAAEAMKKGGRSGAEYEDALKKVEYYSKKAAEAQELLNQKMSDLNDMVRGELGGEIDDFNEKQDELSKKILAVRTRMEELEGKKYLTKAQKKEFKDLKGELEELNGEFGANADAHDEATKRILFNILTERAAIDGLTEAEYNALLNVATQWGLIDEATATAMSAADEFFSGLDEDAKVSQGEIDELDRKMRGLPTDASFNLQIRAYVQMLAGTPRGQQRYGGEVTDVDGGQFGLHGFIPPGYPNDSYLLAASSGERVDITPASQTRSTRGGDLFIVNNYDRRAAAMSMAQLALVRKRRLNDSMGG